MKFVFDIDNTILYSEIDKDGNYKLKRWDPHIVNKINELYKKGDNEIILWTGRHWNHLQITIEQLDFIDLKYDTLICGKPVADYYIDDKALRPNEFLNMEI